MRKGRICMHMEHYEKRQEKLAFSDKLGKTRPKPRLIHENINTFDHIIPGSYFRLSQPSMG